MTTNWFESNLVQWLVVLFLLVTSSECNPIRKNMTVSSVSGEKGKSGGINTDLLAKILGPVCGAAILFIITTFCSYFCYKNANFLAVKVMDVGSSYYGISKGCCKNAYCWSFNVFCSSWMCWFHQPCGQCCTCKKCLYKSESAGEVQRMISLGKIISGTKMPDVLDPRDFDNLLRKTSKISFQEFLKLHQRYSDSFSNMSHRTHCKNEECKKNNHIDFERSDGFQLEPVMYYFVIDWIDLVTKNYEKSTLLHKLLRDETVDDEAIDKENTEIIDKRQKNVWFTLINFPVALPTNEKEKKLLLSIIQLFYQYNVQVANIVLRDGGSSNIAKGHSIWDIEEEETSLKLSLSERELKRFPEGTKLDIGEINARVRIFDKDGHLINKTDQDDSEMFTVSANSSTGNAFVTIELKDFTKRPRTCRIYLGDDDNQLKNDRLCFKQPYLECLIPPAQSNNQQSSPVVNQVGDQLDSKPRQNGPQETYDANSSDSLSLLSNTAPTPEESTNSGADPVFDFETKNGVEITVKVTQMRVNDQLRLAGILDVDNKWNKVADVVFKDMPAVLKKEIAHIETNGLNGGGSSGGELLKLVTRAYKGGQTLTWGEILKICENEKYKFYDIETGFEPREKPQVDTFLKDFTTDQRERVGRVLDIDKRWKTLARDEFDFDDTDITPLENVRCRPGEFRPTLQLLGVICEKKPNYSLKELAKACHDQTLENAVKLLRGIGESRLV